MVISPKLSLDALVSEFCVSFFVETDVGSPTRLVTISDDARYLNINDRTCKMMKYTNIDMPYMQNTHNVADDSGGLSL